MLLTLWSSSLARKLHHASWNRARVGVSSQDMSSSFASTSWFRLRSGGSGRFRVRGCCSASRDAVELRVTTRKAQLFSVGEPLPPPSTDEKRVHSSKATPGPVSTFPLLPWRASAGRLPRPNWPCSEEPQTSGSRNTLRRRGLKTPN